MKHTSILFASAAICALPGIAQQERTNNYRTTTEEGIIESIANIEKKTDKFNLFLDMHGSFNLDWNGSHSVSYTHL